MLSFLTYFGSEHVLPNRNQHLFTFLNNFSCEHVLTFLGASEAGLIVTSLNPSATAGQLFLQYLTDDRELEVFHVLISNNVKMTDYRVLRSLNTLDIQ